MVKKKLTGREYARAIYAICKTSFRIAPSAAIVQIFDSLIEAVLPIITTALAALTTTALAEAYAGDESAADRVLWLVVATSISSIVMLGWNSVSYFITQKTRYRIDSVIEDDMITQFGLLPFEMYDDKDIVDMHEKAKRFSVFFSYIFEVFGKIVTAIFGTVGSIVALVYVNWLLSLVVLLAVIPGIIIQLKLARQQAQHWETNITNRRRKNGLSWIVQEPKYMAELRVYGVIKHLVKMYKKLRDDDEKERLQLELNTTWKQLSANILEAIVELGSLVWIVLQIIDRAQPVGQFVYVQQMVGRAMSEAGSLATQVGRIDEDLANLVDYQRFMDIEIGDESSEISLRNVPQEIVINDVSFNYPKTDKFVLDKVALTIKKGQHIAIVGENGAGKSTLIKIIMGLYQPSKGIIQIDGKDLKSIDAESWHRYISLLTQDFITYHFATIRENIIFGDAGKSDEEAFKDALKNSEFDSVVNSLKHKENTYIDRWITENDDDTTATELSGGQYQRLALARNFYRDAPIVVLDEPTSAIDAVAEAKIFRYLFSRKDKTIIAISHRLSTVKKADVIYLVKDGRVIEQGSYETLIKKNGEFVKMFASQINS